MGSGLVFQHFIKSARSPPHKTAANKITYMNLKVPTSPIFILFIALFLVSVALNGFFVYSNNIKASVEVVKEPQTEFEQEEENDEVYENKKKIDIENTVLACNNGEAYFGKTLIEQGLTFKAIGGMIFYTKEELMMFCDPELVSYDEDAESNFHIVAAYK